MMYKSVEHAIQIKYALVHKGNRVLCFDFKVELHRDTNPILIVSASFENKKESHGQGC